MRRAFRMLSPLLVGASLVAFGGEHSPDAGKHKHRHGGCPPSMVRVRDFCMDRFEAPNHRGHNPLVMQSAKDAEAWCAAHRKRLCTEDEWIEACEGEERRAYPYGTTRIEGRCNDSASWRAVDEAKLGKWPSPEAKAHVEELYQAAPSGARHHCVSGDGVHDLLGNVEEWVVRTREHANRPPYLLIGCYWSGCYGGGKPTCHSTNNAHGPEFRFYETGFRCCRDVGTNPQASSAATEADEAAVELSSNGRRVDDGVSEDLVQARGFGYLRCRAVEQPGSSSGS